MHGRTQTAEFRQPRTVWGRLAVPATGRAREHPAEENVGVSGARGGGGVDQGRQGHSGVVLAPGGRGPTEQNHHHFHRYCYPLHLDFYTDSQKFFSALNFFK